MLIKWTNTRYTAGNHGNILDNIRRGTNTLLQQSINIGMKKTNIVEI